MGARRAVFEFNNNFILKVAKTKCGVKSNRREVMTYKIIPKKMKKHLAEIIKYDNGYHWLIMKKYIQPVPKTKIYRQKIFSMKAKFRRNGIIPYEVTGRRGPNYHNIRLKPNGEIVVIDYGNFRFLHCFSYGCT